MTLAAMRAPTEYDIVTMAQTKYNIITWAVGKAPTEYGMAVARTQRGYDKDCS